VIFWSTLVYDIIARWTWYFQGWQKLSGSLDFAGGTAVHICSGATVAGYAIWYGVVNMFRSSDHGGAFNLREGLFHNTINVVVGTALLWIGWLGFNGGSALGINLRAVSACMCTVVAPAFGGTTSLLLNWAAAAWIRSKKDPDNDQENDVVEERPTLAVHEFCDGVVVALVAITPGAGYV
jgi:Amt family ammonium transporter